MNKADLLEYLNKTSFEMARSNIDEAIILHFDLMMGQYQTKPFFYKSLFKYDRYRVALALLSFSYTDESAPLSKVKAFCHERGYMSRNSLDSYISFFIVTGNIKVWLDVDDGRQRRFQLAEEALRDAARVVKSYLLPSEMISPYGSRFSDIEMSVDLLKIFFRGFSKLFEADCLLDKLLPEAKWFVNRDGGHLLMLALYTDTLRNGALETGYTVSSYVEIASRLAVSKTHVQRMIRDGELQGYFKVNKHVVAISPMFIDLIRRAMSIYFAIVWISMELGVDESGGALGR